MNNEPMSGDTRQGVPDYSRAPRNRVPEDATWRVSDIYPHREAWEKDRDRLVDMIGRIDGLARDWTGAPERMLRLMEHVTAIEKIEDKTHAYASLHSDTDMVDSTWQAMKGEIDALGVDLRGKLAFMDPDIIDLGEEKIAEYIKAEPGLGVYRRDFDVILRMKDHILSTEKEEILARTGLFSGSTGRAAKVLNDVDIPAPRMTLTDGRTIKLDQAAYVLYRESKHRPDRLKVMRKFWKHHSTFKTTHAVLLDGAVKAHYFRAGVRRFNGCLEAALYPHNIDTVVYHNLIETVNANLGPLHRYLKLKTRLLGLDRMSYDDIYASSVPAVDKTFTFEEAQQLIVDALHPLGEDYAGVLKQGFSGRWTDIYPNKGKRTGAYSKGSLYDIHPYVLMNYNGTFSHVSTLAHEFGHALHSWYSNKTQPYPLAHYPIFLAEIASTFNETLLVHHMVERETDDMFRLFLLDRYLEEFRGTLYRQTLFAEFELAIHERVEKGQALTSDWLDRLYLGLTRRYYGHKAGVTEVRKHIENEWSNVPHFYYNFYVYQYSTGIASATALAEKVLKGGPGMRDRYLDFLKSGRTKYPLETLKETGVDLTTPEPIRLAIDTFERTVQRMEEVADRLRAAGKLP